MIKDSDVKTMWQLQTHLTKRQNVELKVALGAGCKKVRIGDKTGNLELYMPNGSVKTVPRHKYKARRLRLAYLAAGAAGVAYLVADGFFTRKVGAPGVAPSTNSNWVEFCAMLGLYLVPLISWPTVVRRVRDHRLLVVASGAAAIFGLRELYEHEKHEPDEHTRKAE
jgi:hypothetical protein